MMAFSKLKVTSMTTKVIKTGSTFRPNSKIETPNNVKLNSTLKKKILSGEFLCSKPAID
jgi:hypothetical protein